MEFARQLHRALELRPRIVAFEPRMLAVEQRGAQYLIAIGGIFVAQLANMIGDPEDFLDEHQTAAAFALCRRMIDSDFRAIVHRHADHFAHRPCPLPCVPRVS